MGPESFTPEHKPQVEAEEASEADLGIESAEAQEILSDIEQLQEESVETQEDILETRERLNAQESSVAQTELEKIEESYSEKINVLRVRFDQLSLAVLTTIGGSAGAMLIGKTLAEDPSLFEGSAINTGAKIIAALAASAGIIEGIRTFVKDFSLHHEMEEKLSFATQIRDLNIKHGIYRSN